MQLMVQYPPLNHLREHLQMKEHTRCNCVIRYLNSITTTSSAQNESNQSDLDLHKLHTLHDNINISYCMVCNTELTLIGIITTLLNFSTQKQKQYERSEVTQLPTMQK